MSSQQQQHTFSFFDVFDLLSKIEQINSFQKLLGNCTKFLEQNTMKPLLALGRLTQKYATQLILFPIAALQAYSKNRKWT